MRSSVLQPAKLQAFCNTTAAQSLLDATSSCAYTGCHQYKRAVKVRLQFWSLRTATGLFHVRRFVDTAGSCCKTSSRTIVVPLPLKPTTPLQVLLTLHL
jgi:hypothetical protein